MTPRLNETPDTETPEPAALAAPADPIAERMGKLEIPDEIELSDGRKAVFADGYGRHLPAAQAMVDEPDQIPFALIALLVTIDGARVSIADAEDLPIADVLAMQAKIMGGDAKGAVPEGAAPTVEGARLIPLATPGAWAEVRKGKGRDLTAAQRMADKPEHVNLALIAVLCRYKGEPVVYEDVLTLPLADVLKMQAEALGK